MQADRQVRALAYMAVALGLSVIGVDAEAQIIVRRAVPVVVVPQPVMVAPQVAVVQEGAYIANPLDALLVQTAPAPADVVYMNGGTYVWVRDEYGHRVQRFYGHGDLRHEVYGRHEMLDRMRRENGGRLPEHGARRDAAGHWGGGAAHEAHEAGHGEAHAAAGGAPHPGGAPGVAAHAGAPAAAQHAAAPAPAAQHAAAPAPSKKK